LLAFGSSVILLKFPYSVQSPFFGNLTVTPIFYSSASFFCIALLSTSSFINFYHINYVFRLHLYKFALMLSTPGNFQLYRLLMAFFTSDCPVDPLSIVRSSPIIAATSACSPTFSLVKNFLKMLCPPFQLSFFRCYNVPLFIFHWFIISLPIC